VLIAIALRRAGLLGAVLGSPLFGILGLPGGAVAAPSAKLGATLTPKRLGQGTTVGFTFRISASGAQVPPPLVGVSLRYPENLGIALSGIGVANCSPETLTALGPYGCPPNSVMGRGSATAEIPVGPQIVAETAPITIVRAPEREGRLTVLMYAFGLVPIDAQIVFPGLLLPAPPPFGGLVNINVPLVTSLTGAPNVSVVKLHTTLGPQGLTYYRRSGASTMAYRPRGILLPDTCPRSGFPFAAEFTFADGSHATARTAVACPRPVRRRKGKT
jgi:hypothetical protein